MSLQGLCSIHAYDVLEYIDVADAAMGKGGTWKKTKSGRCRFAMQQSAIATSSASIRDYTVTNEVCFASDPHIPNGARLQWRGTYDAAGNLAEFVTPLVMVLTGPVINVNGLGRLWKVHAVTHQLANLDVNKLM